MHHVREICLYSARYKYPILFTYLHAKGMTVELGCFGIFELVVDFWVSMKDWLGS